jgi:hypothetical protein
MYICINSRYEMLLFKVNMGTEETPLHPPCSLHIIYVGLSTLKLIIMVGYFVIFHLDKDHRGMALQRTYVLVCNDDDDERSRVRMIGQFAGGGRGDGGNS